MAIPTRDKTKRFEPVAGGGGATSGATSPNVSFENGLNLRGFDGVWPGPSGFDPGFAALVLGDIVNGGGGLTGIYATFNDPSVLPAITMSAYDGGSSMDLYFGGGGWGGSVTNRTYFYASPLASYPSTEADDEQVLVLMAQADGGAEFNTDVQFNGDFIVGGTPGFYGINSTGAGSAALGSNSPATTNSAPYTWIKAKSADNSDVWIPAWK